MTTRFCCKAILSHDIPRHDFAVAHLKSASFTAGFVDRDISFFQLRRHYVIYREGDYIHTLVKSNSKWPIIRLYIS